MNEEPHYEIEKEGENRTEMPKNDPIPSIIIDFLKKCLSKNPKNRFENAVMALKKWEHEILIEAT